MTVHNHGIDPSCRERTVGECLLKPGAIVLDLAAHHLPTLAYTLRNDGFYDLADQIEAQTKPPRIPEPGLWGVVTADGRGLDDVHWVRDPSGWTSPQREGYVEWGDLVDPVLVREGVA